MANRVIAIGGVPASGKSTMMKKIIKSYLPLKTFKYKLVRGLYNAEKKIYILGIYDNSVFSGTDKLSMAVQPDFIELLNNVDDATFVFEGDRLFNQSLFDKKQCEIIVIQATKETIKERHLKRNDNQTDKFKKAKQTKIQNIISNNEVTILDNNSPTETLLAYDYIINRIENEQNRTH